MIAPARPAAVPPTFDNTLSRHTRKKVQVVEHAEFERDRVNARFGQPNGFGVPDTFMYTVRKFSHHHPIVSASAALASIGALAGLLGWLSESAVDKLAHMTNRKNDRVGEVVGAFVGCAIAFTHTMSLFGAWRRLDIRYGLRSWRKDSQTAEGQSRRLIERRAAPLLMAMIENAKAEVGVQHDELRVAGRHVADTLTHIRRQGITKDVWDGSAGKNGFLIEHTPAEAAALKAKGLLGAGCTAAEDIRWAGIKKGHYYETRYTSFGDLLDQDIDRSFDANSSSIKDLIAASKPTRKPSGEFENAGEIRAKFTAALHRSGLGKNDKLNIDALQKELATHSTPTGFKESTSPGRGVSKAESQKQTLRRELLRDLNKAVNRKNGVEKAGIASTKQRKLLRR